MKLRGCCLVGYFGRPSAERSVSPCAREPDCGLNRAVDLRPIRRRVCADGADLRRKRNAAFTQFWSAPVEQISFRFVQRVQRCGVAVTNVSPRWNPAVAEKQNRQYQQRSLL